MAGINGIDYSDWSNNKAVQIAKEADKDGVKGLQGIEIFDFARKASTEIEKGEIYNLLGLSISQTRAASKTTASSSRSSDPEFDKAVDYYNTKLPARTWLMFDDEVRNLERHKITEQAQENLRTRLYNMEAAVNQAKAECAAFLDPEVMIVPAWYRGYRFRIDDRLTHFDIAKLRTNTKADMEAIYEFKDKIEHIMEDAKGETKHNQPQKTDYDVDAMAKKYFDGMSYEEFAAEYQDELDFCKTVVSPYVPMTERQAFVYQKARAYAAEMLNITINEVYNTKFDAEEKLLYETLDATEDSFDLEDFEYDGITEEGLNEIQSGITYKAFEEALISKYREQSSSGIKKPKAQDERGGMIKTFVNGVLRLLNPEKPDEVYDLSGRKIK